MGVAQPWSLRPARHRIMDLRACARLHRLPQKDEHGARTDEEARMFKRGLQEMGACYASMCGTTVLVQKTVPPQPDDDRYADGTERPAASRVRRAAQRWASG